MECSGYSPPRGDAFPAGLRVLVVDDDPTWLKILEKMLKKCSYEVTTCGLAREALDLLRERKDGFDIVISDVNMPDMDGFKLLEHVGLEMDLPVIMMSVDGETSRVMKGVQHGACDYLLKPVRLKELRNIWQHVLRKRIHEVRDIESHEGLEEIPLIRNGSGSLGDGFLAYANDPTSGKKRKDFENKHDGREYNDPSSAKKTRVVWTVELHQKFVKAVNQIGFEKVGPKKILDLMGVSWLTRENIASHLQKYRLYLSRLQKEKEFTASFNGIKHADPPSKEYIGNHCPQNSTNKHPRDFTNRNYSISGNSTTGQDIDSKIHEAETKFTVPMAGGEPKQTIDGDNADHQKSSISSALLKRSFGQIEAEVNLRTTMLKENPWHAEVPKIQYEEESRQNFRPKNDYSLLQLPTVQPSFQFDCVEPCPPLKSKPSSTGRDVAAAAELKPAYVNSRSHGIGRSPPKISTADLFSVLSESQLTGEALKPQPSILWNIGNHSLEDSGNWIVNLANLTEYGFWDEEPQGCSFQGDFQPLGVGLKNTEPLNYADPEVTAEVPASLFDMLKFDYEYPLDSTEYSVIDDGLFIM